MGAEAFSGIYENTEIYHKIRKIMGFEQKEARHTTDPSAADLHIEGNN